MRSLSLMCNSQELCLDGREDTSSKTYLAQVIAQHFQICLCDSLMYMARKGLEQRRYSQGILCAENKQPYGEKPQRISLFLSPEAGILTKETQQIWAFLHTFEVPK